MGRPDSLGVDLAHNRQFPLIDGEASEGVNPDMIQRPYCGIIRSMVDLSRIIRNVCSDIYLSSELAQNNLEAAQRIEQDLDYWLDNLPSSIRPVRAFALSRASTSIRDAHYMQKQRLILSISTKCL